MMDETRAQAYTNLIQQLLSCPKGEEPQILQDNQELLDRDLSQVLLEESQHLLQVGRIQEAEFLINLSQQLLIPGSPHYERDYHSFLMEVLQTVSDAEGNPEQVYPFLQQNLDQLDLQLVQILTAWANDTFAKVETAQAYGIAAVIVTLGNLIQQFPLGSRLVNLEIAIACYQLALEVYTRKDFPEDWARVQNNLAIAYNDKIMGNRAENIDTAIACYQLALEVRTRADFPEDWAMTQNNLAVAYSNKITGNRAENIDRAIACYQLALEVYTREDFPEKWAMTQNNLAIAYSNKITGNRAENIDRAIACYQLALEVYTREDFPEDWAETQNNLANAYSNKITGNRAENIDTAIACYQLALEVRTREDFPEKWATTQNNLANAYLYKITDNRAKNIDTAIACYQQALKVRTREDFPEYWATTQNNLATAYSNKITGNRAENIDRAIACYQLALKVRTREDFPEYWAETQNNLANAYRNKITGNRAENAENIDTAIACYQLALEVYTREDFPEKWAMTQNNLATAYRNKITGHRAENIDTAIACCQLALAVYTREDFPEKWATTQNNLATAYLYKITGHRAENIDTAITCCQLALAVYTRKDFPQDWAMTQNNLGLAYSNSNKITGNRAENIDTAIQCYRQALEIRTPSAFPLDCLQTGRNLGNLAFELQDWNNAIYGYENAITAVEQSREWAGTEAAKQEIQENAIDVYFQMLQTCINAENLPKAVETVERSKARNLVELLATRDLYPKGNIPQEILDQLDHLRRNIPAIQRHLGQKTTNQLSQSNDDTEKQLRSELTELQKEQDRVLAQINIVDPDFNLTQRVEVIPYSEIQSLAANNTAIIEWYITRDKFLAFVIAPNSLAPIVWQSSTADFNNLENWNNEYVGDYRNNNAQWQQTLADNLQRLAEILHLDELLNLIPPTCDQLVLIPHSYLHLFPLHALLSKRQKINKESSQLYTAMGCLLDLFSDGVSYAPSCQLLQLAKKRDRPNFSHLFAIANPTSDRYLLELQAANIRQGFQSDSFWQRDNANKQAILNDQLSLANCAHFGCHGEFKPDAPLESALILANKERLTLLEILTLNLSQCRLVTLSACETGLTETSTTDEYIGLPFGFLLAGSPSMVSTLWKVDQLASTLLLIRFYENIKTLSTVTALNEAQQWLRNLTSEGLEAVLERLKPQIEQTFEKLPPGRRRRFVEAPQNGARKRPPPPFAEPHYWAAFTAIGV
ncbi:CHAT domain-containing protein [Planktothrix agardhii 1033]|nr:CHAT domain-containing protein [Planktothrix agardhii 1033]